MTFLHISVVVSLCMGGSITPSHSIKAQLVGTLSSTNHKNHFTVPNWPMYTGLEICTDRSSALKSTKDQHSV